MSESIPHFLRCSWCANYFDATLVSTDKPCCPDCTAELSSPPEQLTDTRKRWLRCPICHKAIQVQTLTGRQYSLEIHLRHTRKEQKQKRKQWHLIDSRLRNNDLKTTQKIVHKWERFSLKAWYPESTDCSNLFWYSYAINI